jgi:AraC family transcriptional activator of pobA
MLPRYGLYGENPQRREAQFLHLETIKERSAPVRGAIRPHIHADLAHIFLITTGGGQALVEAERRSFDGPHLFLIPSGLVHGFTFDPDIDGFVLTLASALQADLVRQYGLGDAFDEFVMISLTRRSALRALRRRFSALRDELSWRSPAWRAAAAGGLISLLVDIWRLGRNEDVLALPTRPAHRLVTRLRAEIERSYRDNHPLCLYLQTLRVTEPQLRYACEKVGASPPMRMILERKLTEARRLLLYSEMSIAEIALYLGFEDPSYFSRIFAREVGAPPRAFRQLRRSGETLRAVS